MTSPLSIIAADGSVTLSAEQASEVRTAIKGARYSLERAEEIARHRDDRRVLRGRINDLNSALLHLGRI